MRLSKTCFALAWAALCIPTLMGQAGADRQEGAYVESLPPELSNLQLDPPLRSELENALRLHDYKRAEAILVQQADLDPKSVRAAKLLAAAAGIFFLDGHYLNSAIAWKKAEAIAPLDERSRFTLSMAYIKLNRRDWAKPELEKLFASQPQNPLYLYWLARLDYDAQKHTSAITKLQKVVELAPKMMRAYDMLGLCYDFLGQLDDAVKNYNRAIELNRLQSQPSAWPHVNLAVSLVTLNQLEEAEKNLRQAIGYDPKLPQAHYQLGRALEKQGRNQEAVKALRQAAALAPAYAEPHFVLSRVYHKLGENQLAKAEIERFLQLKQAEEQQPPSKPAASRN